MLFITNFLKNNKLAYNSKTVYHFENYIGFQCYAVSNINDLAFKFLRKIVKCPLELQIFKSKRKKFYNSQFRF